MRPAAVKAELLRHLELVRAHRRDLEPGGRLGRAPRRPRPEVPECGPRVGVALGLPGHSNLCQMSLRPRTRPGWKDGRTARHRRGPRGGARSTAPQVPPRYTDRPNTGSADKTVVRAVSRAAGAPPALR
jgi:hypothetical protein